MSASKSCPHPTSSTQEKLRSIPRTRHDARLDFRLSREAKERIEKAALMSGQSLSDFAAATLVREAEEVLARHGATVLSDHDRDVFLALLDNPPAPSAGLRQTLEAYERAAHTDDERTVLEVSLKDSAPLIPPDSTIAVVSTTAKPRKTGGLKVARRAG